MSIQWLDDWFGVGIFAIVHRVVGHHSRRSCNQAIATCNKNFVPKSKKATALPG